MTYPEGMISVSEAARRLGRSIEQVRRYLREGKLKGQRIGQQWFIEESALPLRYEAREPALSRIRDAAAVLERPAMEVEKAGRMTREEIRALFRRMDERVEAMRKRLGGDLRTDVVEMLREERESH